MKQSYNHWPFSITAKKILKETVLFFLLLSFCTHVAYMFSNLKAQAYYSEFYFALLGVVVGIQSIRLLILCIVRYGFKVSYQDVQSWGKG